MRGVIGMPHPAARGIWARTVPVGGRRRVGRFVAAALASSTLAALILHLLSEMASRLPAADPLGALSVAIGMAAVLIMLMPFTLLWGRRAQRAWAARLASDEPQGRRR